MKFSHFKQLYTYLRYGGGTIVAVSFALLPLYLIFVQGIVSGFHIGALMWSFFVLCLPFGFASSVFSLPFWLARGRGFAGSELVSWICALAINIYSYSTSEQLYLHYASTHLLLRIISNPWPYWLIIIVCCCAMLFRTFFPAQTTWKKFFQYHALNLLFVVAGCTTLLYLTYQEFIIIINIQS